MTCDVPVDYEALGGVYRSGHHADAEQIHADLIVMGTRGAVGMSRSADGKHRRSMSCDTRTVPY